MSKNTETKSEKRRLVPEFIGIIAFVAGIFILISLFSFSPHDPSLHSASSATSPKNYMGVVGSYGASLLIFSFGMASYLIGALLLLVAYFFLTKKQRPFHWPELLLLGVFIFTSSIFLEIKWENIPFRGISLPAGGIFGKIFGLQLRTYLGTFGSYLLIGTVFLLTLLWATDISVLELLKKVKLASGRFVQWLTGRLRLALGRFQKWREKRAQLVEETPKPKSNLFNKLKNQKSKETPNSHLKAREPLVSKPVMPVIEEKTSLKNAEPKIYKPQERAAAQTPKEKDQQLSLGKLSGDFELPSLALLDPVPENKSKKVDEESLKASAVLLEKKLRDYNVEGRVTEIHPGPVVTMYEFEPAAGVKVNKITNLADDLSLSMGGRPVRIVAPLPGKPAVGIEIPNLDREVVYYKEIAMDSRFQKAEAKLSLALGKNIEGFPVVADLGKMPHLLVAGATGAGKSVGLNSFILSLLLKNSPEDVRFIFIDPKMLELSIYADIPHLLLPVVTQPKKATLALAWAVKEMERRYRLLSDAQVRNIASYNKKFEKGDLKRRETPPELIGTEEAPISHEAKLPFIVIIIDELADLMMVSGREVEEHITRLAQMARAAGIHMILATQRPSVDVITGIIKANFPSRIAFKVTSKHDSRTILDSIGAEHLLGNGDMLFIPPGLSKQTRVHGAFVSDQEIQRVVAHTKQQAKPIYNEEIMNMKVPVEGVVGGDEESDELYDQAVAIVTETRQASISMVQRRLRIGYNRAARLVEQMEAEGIVSAPMGSKGREVLVKGYGTDG